MFFIALTLYLSISACAYCATFLSSQFFYFLDTSTPIKNYIALTIFRFVFTLFVSGFGLLFTFNNLV